MKTKIFANAEDTFTRHDLPFCFKIIFHFLFSNLSRTYFFNGFSSVRIALRFFKVQQQISLQIHFVFVCVTEIREKMKFELRDTKTGNSRIMQ